MWLRVPAHWRLLAIALVVLGGLAVAGTRAVPAYAAGAGKTQFATMVSESGDYIGAGVDRLFEAPQSVSIRGGLDHVEVAVSENGESFLLDFAPPAGDQLHTGEYSNAQRYPFQPLGAPGLSVSGDGRGCNEDYGRFTIMAIHVNRRGKIDEFRALYEQHCEQQAAPALFGEVSVGTRARGPLATAPAAIDWPTTSLGSSGDVVPVAVTASRRRIHIASVWIEGADADDFSVSSDGCSGKLLQRGTSCQVTVAVSPTADGARQAQLLIRDRSGATTDVTLIGYGESLQHETPPEPGWVTMVSEGGNFVGTGYSETGVDRRFDGPGAVTVHGKLGYLEVSVAEHSESFALDFEPPAGESLEDGEYAGARRYGFESPGEPGLSVTGDGRACDREYGRFIIKDIHTNAAGEVDRLWMLYEQHCEGPTGSALFGEIRYGEPPAAAPEAVEPAAIDWPATAIGTSGDEVPVTIVGQQAGAAVSAVSIEGEDAGDFSVASNDCAETVLAVGARCEIDVAVKPTAAGLRTAQLLVSDESGVTTSVALAVNDVPKPPPLSNNWATIAGEGAEGNHLFDEPGAVSIRGELSHVEVALSEHEESFTLDLAPPSGTQLEDREYVEAGSYPFQSPGEPGLSLSGEGTGCSGGTGRFIIKDIHVNSAGTVDRLWALYEQQCGGSTLFGEVRVGEEPTTAPEAVEPAAIDWPSTPVGTHGYTVPVTVVARESGADVSSVAVEGADPDDFGVSSDGCAGATLPAGARCEVDVTVTPTAEGPRTAELAVTDQSGATTTVPLSVNDFEQRPPPTPSPDWATVVAENGSWLARKGGDHLYDAPGDVSINGGPSRVEVSVSERSKRFSVDFSAPSGEQLEDREYADADGGYWGAPGAPGLSLSSGDEVCDESYGRFIIKDIQTNASGEVDRLWALYEQRCEPTEPSVFGEVRFGEPLPPAPEVPEPAAIDWPATPVGASNVDVPVTVLAGETGAEVKTLAIEGQDAGDFKVASDGCTGTPLPAGARCEIDVAVTPTAEGPRTAQLLVTDQSGATTTVPLAVNDFEERPPPLPSSDWATMVGEKCFGECYPFDRLFDALDSVSAEGRGNGVSIYMSAAQEWFRLGLLPPSGTRLEPGEYPDARVSSFESPQPGVAKMYLGTEGRACEGGSGRFTIEDIHVNASNEVDRLRALYEIECEYEPVLFGEVNVGEPSADAPEVVMPQAVDWPNTPVGTDGDRVPVTIVARENEAKVSSVAIEGADAGDFNVSEDECTGRVLSLGVRCEIAVAVKPTATGVRSAHLVITDQSGAKTTVSLTVSS